MGRTLAEKVWDQHVVRQRGEGRARPPLHRPPPRPRGDQPAGVRRPAAGGSPGAPPGPHDRHRGPQRPHARHPRPDRRRDLGDAGGDAARNCEEFGVRLFPMGDIDQGIVHMIGPERGLTQPGTTVVCGDSHTSTHGAFGALAFGIGTSEVEHVLATQTLPLRTVQDHGHRDRRDPAPGRDQQGRHPRGHREDRHRRRVGLRARVPRRGRASRCRWKRA